MLMLTVVTLNFLDGQGIRMETNNFDAVLIQKLFPWLISVETFNEFECEIEL